MTLIKPNLKSKQDLTLSCIWFKRVLFEKCRVVIKPRTIKNPIKCWWRILANRIKTKGMLVCRLLRKTPKRPLTGFPGGASPPPAWSPPAAAPASCAIGCCWPSFGGLFVLLRLRIVVGIPVDVVAAAAEVLAPEFSEFIGIGLMFNMDVVLKLSRNRFDERSNSDDDPFYNYFILLLDLTLII